MEIIYRLNDEGIHLQETRINLECQGYGYVWDEFVKYIMWQSITKMTAAMIVDLTESD